MQMPGLWLKIIDRAAIPRLTLDTAERQTNQQPEFEYSNQDKRPDLAFCQPLTAASHQILRGSIPRYLRGRPTELLLTHQKALTYVPKLHPTAKFTASPQRLVRFEVLLDHPSFPPQPLA